MVIIKFNIYILPCIYQLYIILDTTISYLHEKGSFLSNFCIMLHVHKKSFSLNKQDIFSLNFI